jgi:hypothetical protein
MTAKEQIVELKCIAPKIEYQIDEIRDKAAADYYVKRLSQLAKKARDKYQEFASQSGVIE